MSERTMIRLQRHTLHAFSRKVRHDPRNPPGMTSEAVTYPERATTETAAVVYRALRRSGQPPHLARIHVWLMLIAPGKQIHVEQVTL